MSATAAHPPAYSAAPPTGAHRALGAEACPLCGAPLHPDQDWCLRCGAAARTRLASAPNWKPPVAIFLAVVAICLGVLAAALVKLAGGSGTPVTRTQTVTAPAAAAAAPATPPATAAAPAAGAAGAAAKTTPPAAGTPTAGAPATGTPAAPATRGTPGAGSPLSGGASTGSKAKSTLPSLSGVSPLIAKRLRSQQK